MTEQRIEMQNIQGVLLTNVDSIAELVAVPRLHRLHARPCQPHVPLDKVGGVTLHLQLPHLPGRLPQF